MIWLTGTVSSETDTQVWILAYGGVGIVLGLAIWGRNVIETMGTEITYITPSRFLFIYFFLFFSLKYSFNIKM